MTSVALIVKEELDRAVPVVNSARTLRQMVSGEVTLIAPNASGTLMAALRSQGIQTSLCGGRTGSIKGLTWLDFNRRAWRALGSLDRDAMLWVGSADAALALGPRLWKRQYIVQVNELYDRQPLYRYGLAEFARRAACVVAPEETRAAIMQMWWKLRSRPAVLPNIPSDHPRERRLPIQSDRAKALIGSLQPGEHLALYQGPIERGRDLRILAAVIRERKAWRLALMGSDYNNFLNAIRQHCPELIHIPHVNAPQHLTVTSHADLGIVSYTPDSLNHLFCAPNKIWEFSGFGIPSLCADLPALRIAEGAGAGLCVNYSAPREIHSALDQVESRYNEFARRAHSFFNTVDREACVREILSRAFGGQMTPEQQRVGEASQSRHVAVSAR